LFERECWSASSPHHVTWPIWREPPPSILSVCNSSINFKSSDIGLPNLLLPSCQKSARRFLQRTPRLRLQHGQRRKLKKHTKRTRPSQGDSVLISYLDPNRPEIAREAGERALNSFLRRNTIRRCWKSAPRPSTRRARPTISIGLRVYLRSKSSPSRHLRTRYLTPLRYCSVITRDPRQTLQERATARIENFLHWLVKIYTIKKTSTVTTYWRQLSQLYIVWT
jgi:hypothetical protein